MALTPAQQALVDVANAEIATARKILATSKDPQKRAAAKTRGEKARLTLKTYGITVTV